MCRFRLQVGARKLGQRLKWRFASASTLAPRRPCESSHRGTRRRTAARRSNSRCRPRVGIGRSRKDRVPISTIRHRVYECGCSSLTRREVMHMGDRLNGKVAVVTGASSGIGEATVRALVAEGAAVVAGARRRERLEELVESVTHDGGKAVAVKCDVTDEEQAHDLVQRAVQEFGSIDILVNNAGIMLLSTVGKSLSDQWRAMFEVNVMGLLYA